MPQYPVTQYIKPNGEKRLNHAEISEEVFDIGFEIGAIISAEILPNGAVAIYGRCKGDDEDEDGELLEFAENGPGKVDSSNEPNKVVEKVILLLKERKSADGLERTE